MPKYGSMPLFSISMVNLTDEWQGKYSLMFCRTQPFSYRPHISCNIYTCIYYLAGSASGQDDLNRALWLATRASKMEPSRPLGTTRCIPQEKFPQSHIINHLLTKLVRSRWLDIGLVLFCVFMDLDNVSVHKHAQKRIRLISSHLDLTLGQ